MSRAARERRSVVAVEAVGPYALVRVERGRHRPGRARPVLHARGARPRAAAADVALPRAAAASSRSCSTRSGPARARSRRSSRATRSHVFGPLGNGFRLDVPRPLLVGGGIGIAPLPYLSEALEHPPAVLGFRSAHHAEAAALVPNAEVVIDPVLVTEVLPDGRDVLACGPEPMLEAVRALAPGRAARLGGADGLRLRRVLRLRRRDRRRVEAVVRRRTGARAPPERERLPRRADRAATSRSALDAFVTKTVTPEPREGNAPVRIAETDYGMLNAIGLANPGRDAFLARDAAAVCATLGVPIWVSVGGFAAHEYAETCAQLDGRDDRAEPLVPERRRGARSRPPRSSPRAARRPQTRSTPSFRRIRGTSARRVRAVEAAGADGVSLVNTLRGVALDARLAADARARRRRLLGTGAETGRARRGATPRDARRSCRSSAWAACRTDATRSS